MRTEIESKSLLQRYGFTTTNPSLATDAARARSIATGLCGPFAMKIVSADIVHKVAAGGVRLGVETEQAERVYAEIIEACRASSPSATIDGVLLEEMVEGDVEVFLGARFDPHYGGVVLVGLGGSNVEQGVPPMAALTPITEARARGMIESAIEKNLTQKLSPAAKKTLVQYVMAVAGPDGMLAQGAVSELDINPIIVNGDRCIAVDAVVQDLADDQLTLSVQVCKPRRPLPVVKTGWSAWRPCSIRHPSPLSAHRRFLISWATAASRICSTSATPEKSIPSILKPTKSVA